MYNKIKSMGKKKLAILTLVPVGGILLYLFTGTPKSKEAFINASLSAVITPVSGIVIYHNVLEIGSIVSSDQDIADVISNESNDQVYQLIYEKLSLEQKIVEINSKIKGNNTLLNNRRITRQKYKLESEKQRKLEIKYSSEELVKLNNELEEIKSELDFRQKKLNAYTQLYKNKHLGKIEFENEKNNVLSLEKRLNAKKAEINQQLFYNEGIINGLQLTGARTLDGPQQKMRDLDIEIDVIEKELNESILNLEATNTRLTSIKQLLDLQKKVTVHSNVNGVIWEVITHNSSGINFGTPIIKILNCENRWVDAFFDESDANKILPGKKVKIKLQSLGNGQSSWQGTIQSVRAGSGRVVVGESVVMPPPEIARRQLPVKVITARISVDWKETPDAKLFCLVGRSVTVSL